MAHDFENAIHRIAPPDDLLLPFLDMLLQRSAQLENLGKSDRPPFAASVSSPVIDSTLRVGT
jgi:hypothetical protein